VRCGSFSGGSMAFTPRLSRQKPIFATAYTATRLVILSYIKLYCDTVSNAREDHLASKREPEISSSEVDFWFNSPPLAYLLSSRSPLDPDPGQRSPDTRRGRTPIPITPDKGV
jgi:hypothetical protein